MTDARDSAEIVEKDVQKVPDEVISLQQAIIESGNPELVDIVAGEATAPLGGPETGPASESEPSQANQSSSGGTSDGQSEERRRKTPANLTKAGAGTSRAAANQGFKLADCFGSPRTTPPPGAAANRSRRASIMLSLATRRFSTAENVRKPFRLLPAVASLRLTTRRKGRDSPGTCPVNRRSTCWNSLNSGTRA